MSLRFERGLFQRGTAFAPGALQTVDALADQIASRADQLAVTVIGHADRRPVRDNPWITDNVHLGVLRATSVAELLRLRAGVPADAITIRSAGAADPPFPDQSGADLIRNRTVVVTLSPRDPRP